MFQSSPKLIALLASVLSFLACFSVPCRAGSQEASMTGRPLVIAYVAPWNMPGNGLTIPDIPADRLTHLYYAFGKITDAGLAALSDPCQDAGECGEGDVPERPGGNFAQLLALKRNHPGLRVMISLGGWTGSKNFSEVAAAAEARERFVASCIELYLLKYPGLFDGIDIDWEFPVEGGLPDNIYRPEDRENLNLLLAEFRRQLDLLLAACSGRYALTIAVSASPEQMRNVDLLHLAGMVDWINVMTYDYHAGSAIAHFNAPLFESKDDPTPQLNIDASVRAFLDAGVPSSKLVVGVPFYGRAYGEVASKDNGLFQPGDPGAATDWGEGTIDYRVLIDTSLEARGFTRFWDAGAQVPWLYSPDAKVWITYDDPKSIELKAQYVREHGLAGVMIWELGGDDGSLLAAIDRGLRG
jgi:chitinase